METDESINIIKEWLGTGSINVFGLPYSGKDTVGIRLAEVIGGRFLSSGMILREAEKNDKDLSAELGRGAMASQDKFRALVLPYFSREDIAEFPLVLSSVGRWSGEESDVMVAAEAGGHEIKAVILLNISEADIKDRWEAAQVLKDRVKRKDDRDLKILDTRIREFRDKTMPVVEKYRRMGLLVPVRADKGRDEVFNSLLMQLVKFAREK